MQWREFQSKIRHLSVRDIGRIEQAFELGKKMHHGQQRKSGEPYFNHPVAVAHMLSDLGADTDTLIAAFLHDTVEDTTLTLSEIDRQFNGSVATLIDGVTKLSSKDVSMSPKLDEQIETLRKIFSLMQQDVRIMVIKLVDRLHNMQTVEFLKPERQQTLARETYEIFVKIADRLCMQDLRDELEALCLSVLEPETYRDLLEIRAKNEQRETEIVQGIREGIASVDRLLAAKTTVEFGTKTWDQLKAQRESGGSAVTGVSFITAALVCEDIDSCYRILGALHQKWKREVLSFQDFINEPQLNGYRGLHTTILAPDGTRIRCKIRTKQMQEYAHRGVATVCFRGHSNIAEILPWTKRIAPLTSDTQGSSNDFWQNLRSDILGESITIHGPDDATVQLPHGATALDGVFYLFQDSALRTKTIKVNGVSVAFKTHLTNGSSIDVVFADQEEVTREWIDWTKTGLAAARIHTALAQQPIERKIPVGRRALQQIMTEKGGGLLEEFNEASLSATLEAHGFGLLQEELIAIAEGRRKPGDLYDALFARHTASGPKNQRLRYTVRFSMQKKNVEGLRTLTGITQKYAIEWRSIRMREVPLAHTIRYSVSVPATNKEIRDFEQDVLDAGGSHVETIMHSKRDTFLIATVIILWALNPVMAKWFLLHGVAPLTLITIRFLTICVFMTAFFAVWRVTTKTKFAPIRGATLLALKPTLANACMMVYVFALKILPASVHLMILRFNTLLLPSISEKKKSIRPLLEFLVLLSATIAGFLWTLGTQTWFALLLSCITLVFYTLYSLSTEHTLQRNKIGIRSPSFLFQTGVISGLCGLLLIPFLGRGALVSSLTIPMVIYVVCCVCITQVCYSALLKTTRFKHFTDLFLAEVPLCMVFETLILGTVLPQPTYVIIALIIAAIVTIRWRTVV